MTRQCYSNEEAGVGVCPFYAEAEIRKWSNDLALYISPRFSLET